MFVIVMEGATEGEAPGEKAWAYAVMTQGQDL